MFWLIRVEARRSRERRRLSEESASCIEHLLEVEKRCIVMYRSEMCIYPMMCLSDSARITTGETNVCQVISLDLYRVEYILRFESDFKPKICDELP